MDRDIALSIVNNFNRLNTALAALATGTVPAAVDSVATLGIGPRSLSMDPESEEIPQEETAEPAAEPEPVPETTTRKKSTSK